MLKMRLANLTSRVRAAYKRRKRAHTHNGDPNAASRFRVESHRHRLDRSNARPSADAYRSTHCRFAGGVYQRHRAFCKTLSFAIASAAQA